MIGLLQTAEDALRGRSPHNRVGRLAENAAIHFLRRHGCTVLERNFRARSGEGEIDLVACHGAALVFVKVKKRTTDEYGAPHCPVDSEKGPALERTASEYANRSGVERIKMRFDVVSVVLGNPVRVDWQRGVFRPGPAFQEMCSGPVPELPHGRATGGKKAKVSIKSATLGAIVDVLASILLTTPFVFLAMLRFHLHPGPLGAIAAALRGHAPLCAALALAGGLCCTFGGYVTAWIVNHNELANGLLSSYLAVGIAAGSIAAGERGGPLPAALLLLAISPVCGWLGGYVRRAERRCGN